MNNPLSVHLVDLAENLTDLRRRFRRAARVEVAQAVGEALRELAQTLICGPARFPRTKAPYACAWKDPWQETALDPWHADGTPPDEFEPEETPRAASRWHAAVVVGLGAARWGFVRTRQFPPAVLIGLTVALAAYAGGPTLEALLDAWTTVTDLLRSSDPDSRS